MPEEFSAGLSVVLVNTNRAIPAEVSASFVVASCNELLLFNIHVWSAIRFRGGSSPTSWNKGWRFQ